MTDIEKHPRTFNVRDLCLFVILPIGAFWLRLATFWQSLWYDEVLSARVSEAPYADSLRELAAHNTWHPPLYYWLNHLVLLVTDHDWANRILALVFGLAVFPLMFRFARRLVRKEAAYLSLFLLMVSPIHVQCSRDAREYTLFLFVSLWALERLLAAIEDNKRGQWAAFWLLTVLAMYSSFFAFFALFVEGLFLCFRQAAVLVAGRKLSWRPFAPLGKFALAVALGLVAYAPVLPTMFSRLGGNITPTSVKNPAIMFSFSFFKMLVAKYGCGLGVPLWVIGVALGAGMVFAAWKKPTLFLLAVTFFAGSIAPFFLILRFSREQFFSPRYIIFILPVFLIVVSTGLYAIADLAVSAITRFVKRLAPWRPRMALALAGTVALAVHLPGIGGMFIETNENLRGVCDFIAKHQQPGDAVILQPSYADYMFTYYRKGRFEASPVGDNDVVSLRKIGKEHRRVWYVGCWGVPTERFGNELQTQGFQMIFDQAAQGVRVDLCDKSVSPEKAVGELVSWRLTAENELRYSPMMDVLIARAYAAAGNAGAHDECMARALKSCRWLSRMDPWLILTESSYRVMALKEYGEALDATKRYDEARAALQKALWLAPDKANVMYSLALTEMDQGDYAAAASLFDKVLSVQKGHPYWLMLKAAEAYIGDHELEKAITVCREGYHDLDERKESHAPVVGARRAELIALYVDPKRGIQVCREIMAAYPRYGHIYDLCAMLEFNAGDVKGAYETILLGLGKVPDDRELAKAKAYVERYLPSPHTANVPSRRSP